MRTFKAVYAQRLATCHPDLIRLFNAVNQVVECHPIVGHRNEADQNAAFAKKLSKLQWPNSRHNSLPSMAVDVVPDSVPDDGDADIDWNYIPHFYYLAGTVQALAKHMGIKVRWGGDWDSDGNLKENKFQDLVHFELVP
jgi:peptidoglycan L-alanyl-D-glutamate endopeptidase CwlK